MTKSIQSTAELARHLGLSRWSVSRAINGQSGVGSETVALIRHTMRQHGFTPSPHGRGLRGQRTGVIGICFRGLDTPITIRKIEHVQRLVGERGYRPIFELTGVHENGGLDVINHFISLRVEGVLLVDAPPTSESERWLRLLKRNGIPAAFLEPRAMLSVNVVSLDRRKAMRDVTERVLDLGHRRIGLLGISPRFPLGAPRFRGIQEAVKGRKLRFADVVVVHDVPEHRYGGLRYGAELAESVLAAKRRPTALLALNDEVAAGALWRLQRAGFRCPRDFSLFGFDNLPVGEQTIPSLSTVDHCVDAIAAAATELLFDLIRRGPAAKVPAITIDGRLVHRESVSACG